MQSERESKSITSKQMIGNNLRSHFTQRCCSMLFKRNLASIRSFEGCNVVWFTVFETKDMGLKFICTQPTLHDDLQSYVQLIQPMHSGSKRFGIATLMMMNTLNNHESNTSSTLQCFLLLTWVQKLDRPHLNRKIKTP